MKFGLLSTKNHPLLYLVLDKITDKSNTRIFLDGELSDKSRKIIYGRMSDLEIPEVEFQSIELNHNDPLSNAAYSECDYLINVGTPRIIKQDILDHNKVINVHPGLLPYYRGCTSVEWAIHNNDPIILTMHFMDTGIDTGPIIFRRLVKTNKGDTYKEIRTKVMLTQTDLIVELIENPDLFTYYLENPLPNENGTYYRTIRDGELNIVHKNIESGYYSDYTRKDS